MTHNVYAQYDCGMCAPDGWLSFGCSPTLRLQRLPLVAPAFRKYSSVVFPPTVRHRDIAQGPAAGNV